MRVLNRHRHSVPKDAVYIGRWLDNGKPGKWGNPFAVTAKRTRPQAIAEYAAWFETQMHLVADLHELAGKDLVCSCSPDACHGDFLIRRANPGYNPEEQIPF